MGQILLGRTQTADGVPFEANRNPGYGGVPSDIESTDVQNAIEEVKQDALSNDRFLIFASYNGNANAGRYLEVFPGINMNSAPLHSAVTAKCLTIVAATVAANTTCKIGFYDGATLLYTVTFSSEKRKILTASPLFILPQMGELAIKIDSGSINRPHIYFSLSAST